MIEPFIILASQLAFAVLMLSSACAKIASPRRFAATIDSYMLVPSVLAAPIGGALLGMELLAGLTLLGVEPLSKQQGLALVGILLLTYAVAMAINVRRGHTGLGCGCSGLGRAETPISWPMVNRNLVLAAAAIVFSATEGAIREPSWSDYLLAAPAVVTSLLLYAAFGELQTNRAFQAEIQR